MTTAPEVETKLLCIRWGDWIVNVPLTAHEEKRYKDEALGQWIFYMSENILYRKE